MVIPKLVKNSNPQISKAQVQEESYQMFKLVTLPILCKLLQKTEKK